MAKKQKLVYDRLSDYAKKHQSGLDIAEDYNSRFAEVQQELANYLISIIGNERAEQLLDPLIVSKDTTTTDGVIDKPADLLYLLSASYKGKPVHKLSANQMETYEMIPQRRGDLSKNRVNIDSSDKKWRVKPETATGIKVKYVKEPPEAKISFSYAITDDEYIMAYDDENTVDFVWGVDCVPLLVYMMLEKYGISVRERLLQEYAQLGIKEEAVR